MDDPVITIAGRSFPVPHLSIGQLKFVVPAMLRLKTMDVDHLTEENIEDLTNITYYAILRGTPGFTKGEFTSMPGTVAELIDAYPVIAFQSGMIHGEQGTGEAPAGK